MLDRIEFLTKHFLVLSAAFTAVGAIVSIASISGYFVVFDSSLIWAIEYTDLIKFSLIAMALIVSSFGFIFVIGMDIFKIRKNNVRSQKITLAIVIATPIAFCVIFAAWHLRIREYDQIWTASTLVASYLTIIMAIYILSHLLENIQITGSVSVNTVSFIVILATMVAGLFGLFYGAHAKYGNKRIFQIVVKDKSNSESIYNDATIVALLSQRTILYLKDGNIITIPTTDVVKMISLSN